MHPVLQLMLWALIPAGLSGFYLKKKGYSFFSSLWKAWLGWFGMLAAISKTFL
jgi:hypothetical protein